MRILKDVKFFALVIIAALSPHVFADEKSEPVSKKVAPAAKVTWMADQIVMVCKMDRPIATQCVTKTMPKQVGAVKRIIQFPFVQNVIASWVVFSDTRIGLCALIRADGEIGCHLVLDRPIDPSLTTNFTNGNFYFSSYDIPTYEVNSFANEFVDALSKSEKVLSAKAKRGKAASTLGKQSGVTEPMSLTGGGGGCYFDYTTEYDPCVGDSDWTLIGDPMEMGGIDYSWKCQVIGGMLVCKYGRPALIDPFDVPIISSGSSGGSFCNMFGWFCQSGSTSSGTQQPPMTEAERYKAIKSACIADCADANLPTSSGNDGWDFFKCLNACMVANGYPAG